MVAACKVAYIAFTKAAHPPVPTIYPTVDTPPEAENNAPIVSVENLDV
tara:strand:- start:689 stop:832 length:144 start_codon:yes stop_codon:yes gene_type:complete